MDCWLLQEQEAVKPIYLVPRTAVPVGVEISALPPAVTDTSQVVYGITAWNPLGKEVPLEDNNVKNESLKELIQSCSDVKWWANSFSFSAEWRENGFTVAFAASSNPLEKYIIPWARSFMQGAVYEYTVDDESIKNRFIHRKTVPVLLESVDSECELCVVHAPNVPNAKP